MILERIYSIIHHIMKKQILVIIAVLMFIIGLGLVASSLNNSNTSLEKMKDQTILYYGNTCPHCKELEDYIKLNKIEEKITFIRKEVYLNLNNSRELTAVAKSCGFEEKSIGVPFLYSKAKCYMGKDEVIAYINEEISQKKSIATPSGEKK